MDRLPNIDSLWSDAKPNDQGLVPVVTQDVRSRAVLMLAWANKDALEHALARGYATYWSRSRSEIWEKGAASGNRQKLVDVRLDCDGDTLLYLVDPKGPACHLGDDTCFSRKRNGGGWQHKPQDVLRTPSIAERTYLGDLQRLVDSTVEEPGRLDAQAAALKADAESLSHAIGADRPDDVAEKAAQLVYDLAVALRARGVPFDDVLAAVKKLG